MRNNRRIAIATLLACYAGVIACGCSPDFYRQSADLQVGQILRNSKDATLGYQPQTVAKTTVPTATSRPTYAMVPLTPKAPPTQSPLEPVHEQLHYGPLGPPWPLPPPGPDVLGAGGLGVGAEEQRAGEQLRLGPPIIREGPARLNLYQALAFGVEHSRPYQDQMEVLYAAALNVTLERHFFEPHPFVNQSLTFDGGQRDADYKSALTAATSAGVSQNLPYGGQVVAQALVSFVDALNDRTADGESASFVLSGNVPLLRGAGVVNLEPLIQSERSLVYAVRNFEDFRRQFAVNVASQYFKLVTSAESVSNRRINYEELRGLTDRTQALYDAGRLTFLQVQQALQSQLSAENSLINAQASYEAALDQFKLLLGMDVQRPLEVIPVELKLDVPDTDHQDVIALAKKYRLDLQTARDQIDDARRSVGVAENGLLPDLNLVAQAQVGNENPLAASTINARTSTYSAGINLSLPIDRLAERNTYRQSLINLEQSQRHYVDTEQQIVSDVRNSVRSIHNAQLSLEIQRRAVALAERRVEYANELLIEGQAQTRDVTDAESSLLSAQDSFNTALATLQVSVLDFFRLTGTLRMDPQAGALGEAMDRAARPDVSFGGT